MDSEAAVIRSEMTHTRAELDYKISQLQRKANDLTPRSVVSRVMPERTLDYAIGGVLALTGVRMAWKRLRASRSEQQLRQERLRQTMVVTRGW